MSLQTRLSALITAIGTDMKTRAPAGPPVSVLPGTAVDGQIVDFVADSANGVIWRLRWRSAGSGGGTYKWEFIGGGSLTARSDVARSLNNVTTYTSLATDPLSISVPLPGDYIIEQCALVTLGAAGFNSVGLSYQIGATLASDAWGIFASLAGMGASVASFTEHTLLTGPITVTEKGRTSGNFNGDFTNRRLKITPIRCGVA